MFEAFVQGVHTLFQPATMGLIIVGTLISLTFGIIPGLSGLVSMALLLPFIYKLPAEVALPFLVAVVSCGFTGGSITAILINIPGTGANAPTLIDGFPMNQRGEGSRAIGAAVTSSMLGGAAGVPIALLMVVAVVPIVMAFGSAELCLLVVMGLVFLAVLGGRSPIRGLISGGLGLIASFVGFQEITGLPRFAYGSLYLYDGLGLIPVILGLFAVPELIDMVVRGQVTIAPSATGTTQGMLQGVKDVLSHKWLWLRSTIIGYVVGLIPGMGGEISTWIAYGQAKQTSKNREEFGTGCVEGVIAPESANNAKEAGSLLTTLAFGIPGSSTMAILLGAFLLVGVTPGPAMLTEHLPLSFTLLLGIAVANVLGGIICLSSVRYLVKVTSIHIDFLFPGILAIAFVAAFVVRGDILAVIVVLLFGLLGFFMKRFDYSRPALILAFILGALFERYFFHALKIHGSLFFITPICMAIIAIIIGLFSYPYIERALRHWFKREA